MKKIFLTTVTLLSVVTLAACSSSKNESTKASSVHTTNAETTSSTTVKVDNSQYDAIVEKIKTSLDPENTGEITVEVENDIVDSEYPDGHDVIRVLATGESKIALEETQSAINSNTATDDQKTAIMMFKMIISELAKELPNDTTTISFGYEISPDQYDVIALSSKIKDIIPID